MHTYWPVCPPLRPHRYLNTRKSTLWPAQLRAWLRPACGRLVQQPNAHHKRTRLHFAAPKKTRPYLYSGSMQKGKLTYPRPQRPRWPGQARSPRPPPPSSPPDPTFSSNTKDLSSPNKRIPTGKTKHPNPHGKDAVNAKKTELCRALAPSGFCPKLPNAHDGTHIHTAAAEGGTRLATVHTQLHVRERTRDGISP